jgi:multidrug resistance protein, MATE family
MAGIWLQQSIFWLTTSTLPCLIGLMHVERILILLHFPEDIAQVAGTYAKYNLLWPIPNGVYQCMRFYFQASGLPWPAMYNNLLFLFVNAALNWIFVLGGPFRYWHHALGFVTPWHGMGFLGAAVSLSISRTMQSVVYFWYMFLHKKHHKSTWPETPPGSTFLSHHTKERTWEFLKQSLPNIGTLLFQCCASQATTVLVGRLGELSIASSSALSTVTIPWSGTLSATCCTVSGVRVGYHLGRGDGYAARRSANLVLHFISIVIFITTILFVPWQNSILKAATDDSEILHVAATLVPAMLLGTYVNVLVGTITSGVFSGMGRPLIATLLSFGLELPMSIGGVAVYILIMHGNLLGVYWWQAISGGIEAVIVLFVLFVSNWDKCAFDAQRRQEAGRTVGALTEPLLDGPDSERTDEAAVGATSSDSEMPHPPPLCSPESSDEEGA